MNRARSQPTAQAEPTQDASAKASKRRGNRNPGRRESTLGAKTSAEANRRAAVILTVLAGQRLPQQEIGNGSPLGWPIINTSG